MSSEGLMSKASLPCIIQFKKAMTYICEDLGCVVRDIVH